MNRPARLLRFAFALLLPAAAPAPRDIPARLPDGRTLNFYCAGRGTPTILLESGWSADSRAWGKVMAPLSARYRVCAYDRAGSGASDAGPLPRDGPAIARDLDKGLRAARIAGPFVLVGHSAGGLYIRHFLQRRPRAIRGLVLVDATVDRQQARFAAALGPGAGSLDPLVRLATRCLAAARAGPIPPADRCATTPPARAVDRWAARLSELVTLEDQPALAGPAGSFGRLPVIVIVADGTYGGTARQVWIDLHRDLAARSTRGTLSIAAGSGHLVMRDRPDAVVAAARGGRNRVASVTVWNKSGLIALPRWDSRPSWHGGMGRMSVVARVADAGHPLSSMLHKLRLWRPLEDADARALLDLPHSCRILSPGDYIVREGDTPTSSCLLSAGFACRHKRVGASGRSILAVHMRGDIVDLQNSLLGYADHSVQVLSKAEVSFIPREAIVDLCRTRPNVGLAMWYDTLVDGSIFREWTANNSRRDAPARMAHLLCEFGLRLEAAGLGDRLSYDLPMTQDQLADAVGLTSIHVNRTLKKLAADGLITRTVRSLGIVDWEELAAAADFDSAYLHLHSPTA